MSTDQDPHAQHACETILVVEDDEDIAAMMALILREEGGYHVEHAVNGVAGYALACTCAPDLVLLDLMLPGMDGLALYDLLQDNPETREVPVIFASARCRASDRRQALRAGLSVLDFLAKPFGMDELLVRVDVALHHRPRGAKEPRLAAKTDDGDA
jgi:DNA-binding response OmpR family regulator